MNKPQAFIFDLNGTMIDDMNFHLEVWYDILVNELGAHMTKDEVKGELYGKNQDVLTRIFGNRFNRSQLDAISLMKEKRYQELYRPHLQLLPGLNRFLEESHENGIPMAIGSAAVPLNIDFVLDTLNIRHYFDVIISANDVRKSNPEPETFINAAYMMDVEPYSCIVFEDTPKGVEAALSAGMQSVVLTTTHDYHAFGDYDNIMLYINDYSNIQPSTFVGERNHHSSSKKNLLFAECLTIRH